MLVKEKGKSCFFSSCQNYLHQCKVTAGMSRLCLHPMMLCMQDTSLSWIKQIWACWQTLPGFFLQAVHDLSVRADRNDDCGWRWHCSAHDNSATTGWRTRVSDLISCAGINLSFIKISIAVIIILHRSKILHRGVLCPCSFLFPLYRRNCPLSPSGGLSEPLHTHVWPLSWFSFITCTLI